MSNDNFDLAGREKLAENTEYVSRVVSDFLNKSDDDDARRTTSAVARGQKFFARDEVISALSRMQQTYRSEYIPGQSVNINTDAFKTTLLNQMASQGGVIITKSVNQIDGRTVDFVEMIFGAFLRDTNITPAIKSLLLRLQIPIVKIALLDIKFFYNPKHPARHVLDTVAHIGIGIDDKTNAVYQTMELIIEQLLRGFDKNVASFNTALASLNRLSDIENKKQQQNEIQTRQQIVQEHARQMVLTELQFHMMGKVVPKHVQPLILKHWSTLMFHCGVRHGKDSEQWKGAVRMLKRIINSLQPITDKDSWLSLKSNYKNLVAGIKKALDETKQSPEHIYGALQLLTRTYEKTLSESSYQVNEKEEKAAVSANAFADAEPYVDVKLEAAKQKIARLPKSLKPGVWCEIYDGEDRPIRRFKLSVISVENARLVFVDRMGIKGIEKDVDMFMVELQLGKSRVIADHSIFNHALGQVINSLAAAK
jgi:hypothetical protein